MFGQNTDYKNKRKLAAQQQAYAVENATTAYQRQIELTANQALLARNGASAAGLSTAGFDGSGVSAASVGQASPNDGGSLPSSAEYINSMLRGVDTLNASIGQLRENAVADAQVSKLLSEKHGQDLSNTYNQMTLLNRAIQQGYITKEQGGKAMSAVAQGLADDKNLVPQSDAKTIIDQATASTAKDMAVAQLENERARLVTEREKAKNLGKSTEHIDKQIDALDSQIEVNKAQAYKLNVDASLAPGIAASQINVNNANARVANENADYLHATQKERRAIVTQTLKQFTMANAPTDIKSQIKEVLYKIEQGKPVSRKEREIALDALNVLIKQEANQRGNENVLSNIALYNQAISIITAPVAQVVSAAK